MRTSLCEVVSNPAAFSGDIVSIRAYASWDYHGEFVEDRACHAFMRIVSPEGSVMTPPIKLLEDEAYRMFRDSLNSQPPGVVQPESKLEATFTGRFEYPVEQREPIPLPEPGETIEIEGSNPMIAPYQLVIQRVSAVVLH
jgi:hypothetical protein